MSCMIVCDFMTAACQAILSFIISQSLLRLLSNETVMPSNHLIFCHPFFLPPSIFPNIRVFSNESNFASSSQSIRASASVAVLLMNIQNWLFDLLEVQRTLKSLLQYHNLKASIFVTQPSFWSNSHIHIWLPEKQ